MNGELKKVVYQTILTYPTKSDYEIADHLNEQKYNVNRSLVYRTRNKLVGAIEYTLAQKVAGKFLADFQMASDYFKLQIERLENLKSRKQTIFKKAPEGHMYPEEVDLGPMEILAIEKQQTELWKNIIFLARQGEAIEVMRLIQNGRIPIPTTTSTESRSSLTN